MRGIDLARFPVHYSMTTIAQRLDEVLHGFWEPHPLPTSTSLLEIESRMRVSLPVGFVELANQCAKFSDIFLGLGENYDAHNHIIAYNRYWRTRRRTRRLPTDLVIITNGFMDEDFWCLVRPDDEAAADEWAVEYWGPAPVGFSTQGMRGPRYETFEAFVESLIAHHGQNTRKR